MRFEIYIFIFFISGCAAILGIKSPEPENKVELIKYLLKHDIDTANVFFILSNYFDTLKLNSFKPGWEAGFRPVQFKLFNIKGELVSQYASCEGPLKSSGILEKFPPENLSPIDTTYTLTKESKMIEGSEKIAILDFDYIFVVYWAKFTGIPGRNLVKKIEEYVYNNSKKKILLIKLNTDLYE